MIKFFTKLFVVILFVFALSGVGKSYAQTPVNTPTIPQPTRGQPGTQISGQGLPGQQQQQQLPGQQQQTTGPQQRQPGQGQQVPKATTTTSTLKVDTSIQLGPISLSEPHSKRERNGIFFTNPPGLVRTVEYDAATNKYILYERVGNLLYRAPQYLTFGEYLLLQQRGVKREYFKQLSDNYNIESEKPGFIPQMKIRSKTFEQIFGSSNINIRPQGSAEVILAGQINKNENPLFNTRQRNQFNFNFDQRIQLNVTGEIGDKLKITTNYNTEAQFQFENQIKLDYTGHPDEIIQKIEAGTVSMPLNTTLISGSQALFGVKTKLKFGKLDVTSIFSQQRSQSKNITITNGSQQQNINITAADYEGNKHFFLSQYFRNTYNKTLANIPIISSNVNITKIEVWTTNRTNVTTDSRDILAFIDLGENKPYNKTLIQGGAGFSGLPAGFKGPGFTQQSNSLLNNLPPGTRTTNSNDAAAYFRTTGATDNYAKLTYARKLTDKEFTLHPQLGYISLNYPLNNDEVLAVAYQYSVNGVQYQVGEFSSDRAVDPNTPTVLYTKLLKNELLKTNLPTWGLMMKNIYSLGAYQISPTNFKLNISRLDDKSGIEKTIMDDGANTKSKRWMQITGVDNLDQQNDKRPDGYFDFLEGLTIDSQQGRIMFPVLEPFGSDLAKQFTASEPDLVARYVYQPLYDSTKIIAQQFFPKLNRYLIKGTYTSQSGSEYQLNAVNVPQGSVVVTAGSVKLQEGSDYTIDYSAGRIRILNQALLSSGQTINVKLENNELFGVQQKSLFGSRLDYHVSDKLLLGGTIMHLTEQPITQNEIVGEESISNTIWGLDANYSTQSRFLTRLVDKIPFINTKAPSTINFSGEFAKLMPGSPGALNFAGSKNGTSYLDDFENSRSVIDIKSAFNWQISGTPQMFAESDAFNDLSYGFNRARLSYFNIDPIFYTSSNTIPVSRSELSNHYVRQVIEQEVFPYKQSTTSQPLSLSTLNMVFYPTVRGPYNYTTTGINTDGTLQNPKARWGGMFRKLETNDFESLNVGYIEFWMMDPFIYKPNSAGGDLYLNLGSVSEDILKDGRKSLENSLPVDAANAGNVDETVWGKVSKLQPVINAFDNNPDSRRLQDVGLDGLNDNDEKTKFAPILQQAQGVLSPLATAALTADPSTDDYQYYQGGALDQRNAGILERYSRYNGTDGNSKTAEQSQAELGIQTSASTSLPDGEDINRDNNMSQTDEYFQYRVSIRPQDMVIGQNFINDKITSNVKLPNGTTQAVTWYQFRVPINEYQSKVGNIQDFKAIRFMRMFMTNFADTSILRFATLQLVRGEWRTFNAENNPQNVIADPAIVSPVIDGSTLNVQAVNIEENGNRTPIPYVVPPGINRQRNYNNLQTDTKLNEQSLSLNVTNLRDGYSRAAFRTFFNDLRSYKRIQMFIHAEGDQLRDKDLNGFVRLGVDYQDNYYEYEVPLAVTQPGTRDPGAIWPAVNELDLQLSILIDAKLARNNAKLNGQPWPFTIPFVYTDGTNKVTIKGQPDLSRLRTIMLGVRNPYKPRGLAGDDGLNKTGTVWFDELRLTEFDQRGGWAATARVDAALADFANITVSGSKSTVGFGTLDSRVSDRSRSDNQAVDASASIELGKFFPEKSGIRIPAYVNISTQVSTPQYDPGSPDVELKKSLAAAPNNQARDSIKNVTQDFTTRKSFNFTNVHKERTNTTAPVHVWDVENFAATYAYTEYQHHDFNVENDFAKTYRVALNYNYNKDPKYYTPFAKIIKSNLLALARDFNFSILPSRLNFSINFDRFYSENTLRNNDPNNFIAIPTAFNKNFNITRVYGIGWNLSKALTLDIDATNLSVVDEPAGRINGLKRDTLWENLWKLGRTTNYNHTINLNWSAPINKLPGLDWTALTVRYSTNFNWQSQPEFAINNPTYDVGNSIQNARTIQLNPNLNFSNFYNKFKGLRKGKDEKTGAAKFFLGILTGIKNISGTYTRTEGTFLPGYLPKSNLFGQDLKYDAPGIGFLLGSQADIRQRAIVNGWITTDTLQNQLYVKSFNEDIRLRSIIEPVSDLRIELIAFKTQDKNYQTNFKYLASTNSIENLSPVTTGTYSISFFSLGTAFAKSGGVTSRSPTYQKFLDNRTIVSQRLGLTNLNSGVAANGYADGYGPNAQNVLVPAFLAAYSGKDASKSATSQFPKIPIPNWQISYAGLGKMPFFADLFDSFDLKHGYRSSYNVSSFTTLLQYQEANGAVASRDFNNDFLPFYQFSQVAIFEQFVPLLGADVRFKNSMTANFEYRKTRSLNLSLLNSQLAQQDENILVFGFGYRPKNFRMPWGLFGTGNKDNNDINFKLDVAVRDNKTLIYRADIAAAEVSSGAKNITMRPSIDYVINQRFNLNLFYDSNITKPYTSQSFNTSFTNFGINLKLLLQ
ncbi:cell surface protein SprA [Mucilaginibacter sp. RB4R14]|uniref:T9SS outer membrane translocon Sov/SprA n=1 Tax=Mucilaginibacter aurantiaciroseus TaxID=2949308 RepID=UPI002090AB04|nr:cell surface protein SprA [Mucilaginibacter aurantiaciroseus]MCO5937361.1 cell surface protein SprA [Mucilaginibacter aurantiaciroseus]